MKDLTFKINDQRPALFERSECNIWTDPYVQKQLLGEHLNFSSDGASRKLESIREIAAFIAANSRPASTLLDLGCGPGLYTSIFKDMGYGVTGVDFNKASVEYAAQQRSDISYILADYVKDFPAGNFDTAIMIYCDMGTHSDNDRSRLLGNIYNSLNPGGKFIFDVFTPGSVLDKQESTSWDYARSGGFWSGNEYLLLSQTFHYPENRAFAYQYNLITAAANKHFIVWERYFSEKEIVDILREAGFGNVTIHKDVVKGNDFTSGCEMYIVARK